MIDQGVDDKYWMQQAVMQAAQAAQENEVPVGAVLVLDKQIIGLGFNQTISRHDPSAHAEIVALRQGAALLQNYRLLNSTLYVTLEPCLMCVGALLHARIKRLVYGAPDEKTGAVASVFHLLDGPHNHRIAWEGGCLTDECRTLLRSFFQAKRQSSSSSISPSSLMTDEE